MKLISSVVCLLFLTAFAFAQRVETEADLFKKISFLTQTKKSDDQVKAYELSRTFMAKFGKNTSDEVKKVRDFMAKYEMAALGKKIDEGKTAEAFVFGKEILAHDAENSFVTANLAYAGLQAAQSKKDKAFAKDSVAYAKQTLELYEAKKLPLSFEPFLDEAEARALMHYIAGYFSVDSNLPEAAASFFRSVQYQSKIKNNSYPYYIIAFNYEKEYEKAAREFETKYAAANPSNESRAAEARLEKLLTRMQDAYARAVKLGEAENAPGVPTWKTRYTQIYSFIKGSDAGSAEFLNNVLSTPLPDPNAP